jgi:hypothetical protein
MTNTFKSLKTPKRRMEQPRHDGSLDNGLADVLHYLSGQKDYAILGENAAHMYTGNESYKLPFEVVGNVEYPLGIVTVTPSLFFPEALIAGAQPVDVQHQDKQYRVQVAKPEQLAALLLADNTHEGRAALEIINHFKQELDFEEMRCSWKRRPDYDALYTRMCHAFYELAR